MADEYREELETERTMRDQFMAHHAESPFVAGRVYGFHGLAYFPIDLTFRVTAHLERRDPPPEAYLRTSADGQAVMRYLGDLNFKIGPRALQLRVYHAGEGVGTQVFVPFRDSTSGTESYGPGRYLTLEMNEADEYDLDFNRAINPYCAYTDSFECPFPPVENDLPVPIRAGEKVWSDERNPATPQTAVRSLHSVPAPKPAAQRRPAPSGRQAPKPKATPRKGSRSIPVKGAARSPSRRRR
ncbi:MAG: DUF1684 domain-containing protein [Thermoplasmata archaeon]|nr:DUF1684 domain-containing protein [Thermoplasmata archaeon]